MPALAEGPIFPDANALPVVQDLKPLLLLKGDRSAQRFLAAAQPDIYVKGGDYTLETLDQDERRTVEQAGGKIVIIPFVPGKSTTALLKKISRL